MKRKLLIFLLILIIILINLAITFFKNRGQWEIRERWLLPQEKEGIEIKWRL